jgi:multicomponent Na+:H+ antiporter subunit D
VASLETGQAGLVFILVLSSLLNAMYYFPIIINAFFVENRQVKKTSFIRDELPPSMLWTTALMAVLCVAFAFIQPHWPVEITSRIAASLF